jgi:hypothetical protein
VYTPLSVKEKHLHAQFAALWLGGLLQLATEQSSTVLKHGKVQKQGLACGDHNYLIKA